MLLVGIRAANIPNQEETAILLQFIYKKYEGLTLGEIGLAFEKAVAGELELETASCFESFSTEYFGKIMAAYKKWSSRIYSENQMHVVKPQTTNLIEMKADWKELCETYYQDYIKNNFRISIMPHELYDEFVRCEMMSADAYEDWRSVAKRHIIKRLTAERQEAISAEQIREADILQNMVNNLTIESDHVKHEAKKLAVEFLYKKAREQKRKNLFVKK